MSLQLIFKPEFKKNDWKRQWTKNINFVFLFYAWQFPPPILNVGAPLSSEWQQISSGFRAITNRQTDVNTTEVW